MKRFLSLTLCLSLMVVAGSALAATKADTPGADVSELNFAVPGENVVLHSNTSNSALRFKEAAGPDTFALYGYVDGYTNVAAPDPQEGRFQDPNGVIPDDQGWITVDITDNPVFWQTTDVVNTANLNDNGPGNTAAWCGQTTAQQPGWNNTPGYGNGWNDILQYSVTVSNTGVGQTVGLDFYFNHDTEPSYDFFNVVYDSAGTNKTVYSVDGSNKDASNIYQPPGVQYSTTGAQDIVFAGGDYGGDANDEIIIQLIVSSDGAWSDSDGLWPTDGGAAQVDDITVTTSEGTVFENFEAGFVEGSWNPEKSPFVGDFAEARPRLNDIDPCNDNLSPVMTFVDAGQTVNNAASADLIPGYPTSTGGETSLTWNYGVPGGYVVNYNGGLSQGQLALWNEVWSPEIDWDVAGTAADDGNEFSGAFIGFDVWQHLPLDNNMFFVWHVRSSLDGVVWTDWQDRNFVYYGGGVALYNRATPDVTDLLLNGRQHVQMALGVRDMTGIFPFSGNDATPSPAFDNTSFVKYRVAGPSFSTRQIDLANDGFPVSGSIDASTSVARDGLDIPFDMTRDIAVAGDPANDPGDSVICDIVAVIPGTEITDIRMVWALKKNTFFDDVRTAPARIKDENVDITDPDMWFGEVVHDTCRVASGAIVDDRFFFDLPDENFLYPGDVLHYYLQATDNANNTTTLPGNTTGFGADGYNRGFIVRGLPSITDALGTQPTKLVYNDFGRRGGENDFLNAMGQLGFVEGVDYDTYTTNGPSSGVSNSIGSAGGHGANADQLAGYETIVYFTGNLSSGVMSDGSNTGLNDKADDLGVLTAWHELPGDRKMVHFGDNLFSTLTQESAAGDAYVQTILGADLQGVDVIDAVDQQTAPRVRPLNPSFATEFIAFGGCQAINQFDHVNVLAGAARGHGFVDLVNAVYPETAASVVHDRLVGDDRKVDISFPFGFIYVFTPNGKADVNTAARTELLREIFDFFGVPSGGGNVVSAPAAKAVEMAVYPNPFNPTTTVKFANLPKQADGSVKVFNLRGELVTTLHAGEFGDKSQFVWNGTDNNGASVASGVYMIEGQADGFRQVIKVALVK